MTSELQPAAAAQEPTAAREMKNTSPEIRSVLNAVRNLTFGTIAITIHDSKIVQVDVTEKKRFSS